MRIMEPKFEIDIDAERRMLRVRIGGFFTVADVEAYADANRRATLLLGGLPSTQRVLCEIVGIEIQSGPAAEAFSRFLNNPKMRDRKAAFVLKSSLARIQLRRVLGDRKAPCFETAEEAEAWLMADAAATQVA